MSTPPAGKLSRIARLGGLAGRVSGRYLADRLRSAARDPETRARALDRLRLENAEQIVETIGQLKGAAMKVGQSGALLASVMDLPPEIQAALGQLHDAAAPIPPEQIRARIQEELDAPISDLFTSFDDKPLGTASLGQAHAATLPDGQAVVVKVLHPGIERSVDSDLAAVRALLVGSRILRRPREELDAIFDEVRERLHEELDYLQEAANLVTFAERFQGDPRIRIPEVYPERSSERVLTLSRLPGRPLSVFRATASPEARQRAGAALVELTMIQAFRHRALHADPHPGNFLIEPDGRVGYLDFGCVKRFDEHWIAAYARSALAAVDGDARTILESSAEVGVWRGGSAEAEALLMAFCELIGDTFRGQIRLGPETDAFLSRAHELGTQMMRHPDAIQASRHILYLHRTLGGVFALGRELDVALDFEQMGRPHLQYAVDFAAGQG